LTFPVLASANDTYNCIALQKGTALSKQLKRTHTLYEIQYDYDLHDETLKIPVGSILQFKGGHIANGTIIFDNTIIKSYYKEVYSFISVEGSIVNDEVRISWWKLAYDKNVNDAILFNQIVNAIDNCVHYYDIQQDVFVGTDKTNWINEETVAFLNKKNLIVIQPTEYYTILRGRSTIGSVVRCNENKYISIDGLKVDRGHVSNRKCGENGIGVVGNEKVLIQNRFIRNCYSNCFDSNANGTLTKNGGVLVARESRLREALSPYRPLSEATASRTVILVSLTMLPIKKILLCTGIILIPSICHLFYCV